MEFRPTVNPAASHRRTASDEVVVPNRIFVGGLNEKMNEDHLRRIFGAYGQVIEVLIKERGSSGGVRGFGFVTFKSKAEAQDCLDKAQGEVLEIDGQKLNVRQATRRSQRTDARPKIQPSFPVATPGPVGAPGMNPWPFPYYSVPYPFGFYDQSSWMQSPAPGMVQFPYPIAPPGHPHESLGPSCRPGLTIAPDVAGTPHMGTYGVH